VEWIERGKSLEAPIDIWEMLLIEGQGSRVSILFKLLLDKHKQQHFFWRIEAKHSGNLIF
jgi:hypothetical protein